MSTWEFCPGCGNLLDFPLSSNIVTCNLCTFSQSCQGLFLFPFLFLFLFFQFFLVIIPEFEKLEVVIESRPNAFQKYRLLFQEDENTEHDRVQGATVMNISFIFQISFFFIYTMKKYTFNFIIFFFFLVGKVISYEKMKFNTGEREMS